MTPNSKTHITSLIIWSLVWAFAMIATAFVFKGNPVKDWIEAVLFIGAFTFWLWKVPATCPPPLGRSRRG